MTKMLLITAAMLSATLVPKLEATPIIQFDSAGPNLTAVPGATVGWGVQIKPDYFNWISFTFSTLTAESDPVGTYTDLLGSFGGPVNYYFPASTTIYTYPYDLSTGSGLGYYTVDPGARPGTTDQVTIHIEYEIFRDNPYTCGGCWLATGVQELAASISVPSDAPETGTLPLMLAGLALLLGARLGPAAGRRFRG
jgi:hypothetical protein